MHINKVNDKKYVGMTCQSPKRRWRDGLGYSGYIKNAIDKYGWDNFIHKILYENLSKEDADNKEIYLISKCKTMYNEHGYNLTPGGDCTVGIFGERHHMYGKHVSEETKQKLRDFNLGKKLSQETKDKMSKSRSGINNCNFGKSFGEDHLTKLSNSHKIKVVQMSLNGDYIKTHDSSKDIQEFTKNEKPCMYAHTIINACKGKRQSAYGYLWCYENEYKLFKSQLNNRIS